MRCHLLCGMPFAFRVFLKEGFTLPHLSFSPQYRIRMTKECPRCSLKNLPGARSCARCLQRFEITPRYEEVESREGKRVSPIGKRILRRAIVCLAVCFVTVICFYLSLLLSAKPLSAEERTQVGASIEILERAGFADEVWYLRNFTFFRGNDNWLNATVPKENAYAATNYPFEIMTVYPDFFVYTVDDVERAAIILHEARHLQGFDEQDAYEFVWKNKSRIGWTREKYGHSVVWQNVRKQTMEIAPGMFICEFNEMGDCYE